MLAGDCFPFDLHCDKLKSLKMSRLVSEAAQELRALIFGSIFMHGLSFFFWSVSLQFSVCLC